MLEEAELVLLEGLKNRKHWATLPLSLPLLTQCFFFPCDTNILAVYESSCPSKVQ